MAGKISSSKEMAPAAPAGTKTNNPNDNMQAHFRKGLWQENESRVTIRKTVLRLESG